MMKITHDQFKKFTEPKKSVQNRKGHRQEYKNIPTSNHEEANNV